MTKEPDCYKVSLRDHLETVIELKIDPIIDRMDRDQTYVKEALNIYNLTMERRLGEIKTNEFANKEDIKPLHDFQVELKAKANQKTVMISLVVAAAGVLIGAISLVLTFIKLHS